MPKLIVHHNMLDYVAKHGIDAAVEVSTLEVPHIQASDDTTQKEELDSEFQITRKLGRIRRGSIIQEVCMPGTWSRP